MDGVLFLLNQAGIALAQREQELAAAHARIAELEAVGQTRTSDTG